MHKALKTIGFHLSLYKYTEQQIITWLIAIKLLIVMIYPIIVNNHSIAEITFYLRNSVFDCGVLPETLLGYYGIYFICKFFKIQKIWEWENELAPAVLHKKLWICIYRSEEFKGNQKPKLKR